MKIAPADRTQPFRRIRMKFQNTWMRTDGSGNILFLDAEGNIKNLTDGALCHEDIRSMLSLIEQPHEAVG